MAWSCPELALEGELGLDNGAAYIHDDVPVEMAIMTMELHGAVVMNDEMHLLASPLHMLLLSPRQWPATPNKSGHHQTLTLDYGPSGTSTVS